MPSLPNIGSFSSASSAMTLNIRNLDVDSLDANAIATNSLTLTGGVTFTGLSITGDITQISGNTSLLNTTIESLSVSGNSYLIDVTANNAEVSVLTVSGLATVEGLTCSGISTLQGTVNLYGDVKGVKYMSSSTTDGFVLTSSDYATQRMKMYHSGTAGYLKTFNGNLLLLGQNVQGMTLSNTTVQSDLPFNLASNITQSSGTATFKNTTVQNLTCGGNVLATNYNLYGLTFQPTNVSGDANVFFSISAVTNQLYIDGRSDTGAATGCNINFRTSAAASGVRSNALTLFSDQSALFYGNVTQNAGTTSLQSTSCTSLTVDSVQYPMSSTASITTAPASTTWTLISNMPSWVRRVTIVIFNLATSTTAAIGVQHENNNSFYGAGYSSVSGPCGATAGYTYPNGNAQSIYHVAGTSSYIYHGVIELFGYKPSSTYMWISKTSFSSNSAGYYTSVSMTPLTTVNLLTGVRLICSAGTFSAGNACVYYE